MNNLIQLKGRLTQKPNTSGGGPNKLTANQIVKTADLSKLKKNLEELYEFWKQQNIIDGTLINVCINV